ncbi:hypothetical protein ACIO3S_00960 [Nocardioides sp. NPDC087217]|uniref:hypothetical protein n=1 Tax=Nocardioides sp. NPDC087217 TaxID=3364335 RepID=UPI0037FFC011
MSTVAELRKQGYVGELTLVSVDPFPYDRPPLSKEYLAGRRSSTRSRCRLRSGTPSSGST